MFVCLTTGSSYYDNVRPLAYPDSDAVLICFDISRPETLDSVIKKVSAFFKLNVLLLTAWVSALCLPRHRREVWTKENVFPLDQHLMST